MRLFQTNILLAYDNVNRMVSLLCGTVNFFGFEFKAGISAFTVLTLILQIYQASQVRFPQTEEGRLHLWRFSVLGDAESGGLAASILAVSLTQGTVPKGNLSGTGCIGNSEGGSVDVKRLSVLDFPPVYPFKDILSARLRLTAGTWIP